MGSLVFACDLMHQKDRPWEKCAVAVVLYKAMAQTTGDSLLTAEICWIQRLSFEDRAMATSTPVTTASAVGGNKLYVAGNAYMHDASNRSVFCWKEQWIPDAKKELWRFVSASTGSSDFYIVSVHADSYLFVRQVTLIIIDEDGMKKVLVPHSENGLPGAAGVWRLLKLEHDCFSLDNVMNDMFLTSPYTARDGLRHDVVLCPFYLLDDMGAKGREWKITAAAPSKMETGIAEYFAGNYAQAVSTLTELLTIDHISVVDRKKETTVLPNGGERRAEKRKLLEAGLCRDTGPCVLFLQHYSRDTVGRRVKKLEQKLLLVALDAFAPKSILDGFCHAKHWIIAHLHC